MSMKKDAAKTIAGFRAMFNALPDPQRIAQLGMAWDIQGVLGWAFAAMGQLASVKGMLASSKEGDAKRAIALVESMQADFDAS